MCRLLHTAPADPLHRQIFSKEAREKRRAALKEEMQRGYFDDFRDFRDNKGKVFTAPEKLIGAQQVSVVWLWG